jgi:3-ketosteroid 9alpha-monooxygenase subunit A
MPEHLRQVNSNWGDAMAAYAQIQSVLPSRYARGWHCFGLERYIRKGQVTSLEAFGTKLVAFRGEDDRIRVLDAYCPHMGADLSDGTVCGNTVKCPFHNWQWGDGGVCKHIPYARTIPPKARTRHWETMVENELCSSGTTMKASRRCRNS